MSNNTDNNNFDNNNFDNNIELYDLFNIEYSNLVLDLYKEIDEYSNSHHVNFYNKGDIGSFFNLIYNNIDYENSSVILSNIIKTKIKEHELDINDLDDYCKEDDDFY